MKVTSSLKNGKNYRQKKHKVESSLDFSTYDKEEITGFLDLDGRRYDLTVDRSEAKLIVQQLQGFLFDKWEG